MSAPVSYSKQIDLTAASLRPNEYCCVSFNDEIPRIIMKDSENRIQVIQLSGSKSIKAEQLDHVKFSGLVQRFFK